VATVEVVKLAEGHGVGVLVAVVEMTCHRQMDFADEN
jgi:hypothetical protein